MTQIERTKMLIKEALEDCEKTGNYPNLCRLKGDPNGYAMVETYVINLIVTEAFGIKSALAQAESNF
jgi:hypothetical protein